MSTARGSFAYEAADAGLLSPELAAGNRRVKGVRRLGLRLGNWLTPNRADGCSITRSWMQAAIAMRGQRPPWNRARRRLRASDERADDGERPPLATAHYLSVGTGGRISGAVQRVMNWG